MQLLVDFKAHSLQFVRPARTSRDTLLTKPSHFLRLRSADGKQQGLGECSLIPGLSPDDPSLLQEAMLALGRCTTTEALMEVDLDHLPALNFARETALLALQSPDSFTLFDTPFSRGEEGILMNGLIWMDDDAGVLQQMEDRAKEGFRILKMKIGAKSFQAELSLLREIRRRFPASEFELRLDANGAFTPDEALRKLEALAAFGIHSLEQAIKPGQEEAMQELCSKSPIPLALDEELIGRHDHGALLDKLQPRYLILKPSLLGGLAAADRWIEAAEARGIGWWATSALESNIGLNAIAQWCSTKDELLPQGLGTGRLFTNNIASPLEVHAPELRMGEGRWEVENLFGS